ncbi:hypothetical protein JCM5296_001456 [Sporobolomyces johnsonii]
MTSATKGKRIRTDDLDLDLAATLDDPSDFAFASLGELDKSLRCQICGELLSAPVILTSCQHTFCSFCLRQHLAVVKKCPRCQAEANEDRIRRNLAMEEVVLAWKQSRSDLLQLQAAAHASTSSSAQAGPSSAVTSPPLASSSTYRSSHQPSVKPAVASTQVHGKRKRKASVKPEPSDDVLDGSSDIEVLESAPPPNKRSKKKGDADEVDISDPNVIVPCPLCGAELKNGYMASHVEKCDGIPPKTTTPLNGAGSKAAWGKLLSTSSSSRNARGAELEAEKEPDTTRYQPLPNYALWKSKDYLATLKELKLPLTIPSSATSTHDKTAIYRRRHSHFLTLWNANADVPPKDPSHRTPAQLRKELSKWEAVQDGSVAKAMRKDYAKQHEDHFKSLIEQARASAMAARKQQEKPPVEESVSTDSSLPKGATELSTMISQDDGVDEETQIDRDEAAATVKRTSPPPRKRSVKVVSPQPSSPAQLATSPSPEHVYSRFPSSSPSPSLRERSTSPQPAAAASSSQERERSFSPFDPEPPRPSQRVREEEWMLHDASDREEEESEMD